MDLDDEELKATRILNGTDKESDIEKDIKRCEELIKPEHANWIGISNQLAIVGVLARIKELEKENTTLRKANNITKNLTREEKMEDITQVMNKSYKEFMKNFIPVQKVKDVLQNNRNELFGTTYIDDKQYKPYTMQIDRINKIEREILEDK